MDNMDLKLIWSKHKVRLIALIVLAGVALLWLVFSPTTFKFLHGDAQETLREAETALSEHSYQEALTLYQKAMLIDKSNYLPYLAAAEIYSLKNQPQNALDLILQGVQNAAEKKELYLEAGRLSLALNDPQKAREYLLHADQQDFQTHLLAGQTYLVQDNLPQAQKMLSAATTTQPTDPASHYYLALALVFDDPQKALEEAKTATERSWEGKAKALSLQQTLAEMLAAKNDLFKTTLMCYALLAAGYPQPTINPLKAVLRQDPKYRDALILLGTVQFKLEQENEALSYLNAALQIDPAYAQTSLLLGQIYESQTNFPEAQKYFEQASELEHLNVTFLEELATFYERREQFTQATDTWEKLTANEEEVDLTKIENEIHLAFLYLDKLHDLAKGGDWASQLKTASDSDSLPLPDADLKSRIEDLDLWFSFSQGKEKEALEGYQTLVTQSPYNPLFWYHKAKVEEALGKKKESKESLTRARDLDLTGEIGLLPQ